MNNPRHPKSAKRKPRNRDVTKLSAALAPLEEQNPQAAGLMARQPEGPTKSNETIVVDAHDIKVPRGITDKKFNFWPSPVVLVIVSLCVAFILFIAWQISRMPSK